MRIQFDMSKHLKWFLITVGVFLMGVVLTHVGEWGKVPTLWNMLAVIFVGVGLIGMLIMTIVLASRELEEEE